MAFMLGSFTDGMFGAARSVMSLYGMYNGLRQQERESDAADAVKKARDGDESWRNVENTVQDLREKNPDASTQDVSAPSETVTRDPNRPVADILKLKGKYGPEPALPIKSPSMDLDAPGSPPQNTSLNTPSAAMTDTGAPTVVATPALPVPGATPDAGRALLPRTLDTAGIKETLSGQETLPRTLSSTYGQAIPSVNPPPVEAPATTVREDGGSRFARQRGRLLQNAIPSGELPSDEAPWAAGLTGPAMPGAQPLSAIPAAEAPMMDVREQGASRFARQRGRLLQGETPPPSGASTDTPAAGAPLEPPPTQPAQGRSLGSRILGALNPIGSANAAEPPARALPAAPTEGPGANNSPTPTAVTPALPAQTPQAARQPPQQVQAGPVAVQGSGAQVAPGQVGPSVQSETTPTLIKPPLNPRPYAALAEQAPGERALVDRISAEEGVSPDRLAWHWHTESRFKPSSPRGSAGEIGIMQILPSTRDQVDPRHSLDPDTMEGGLRLGARIINLHDREFGKDSPGSVAAYMRGAGWANHLARSPEEAQSMHPKAYALLQDAFGQAKLGRGSFTESTMINPRGLIDAAQSGPDGVLNYLIQTGPKGMQLTDLWRQAETALLVAAAGKGDYAGMQHARDFVLQMSQQGATTNMMMAYHALGANDGTGAARFLARAHAFFPDGTMGRFGVDGRGQVWGERLDEHDPSRSIGKPFQVTQQTLAPLLIQTRDPNAFLKLVTQQQKEVSAMRYQAIHGDYLAAQPGIEREKTAITARGQDLTYAGHALSADARVQSANTAAQARVDAAAIRTGAANDRALSHTADVEAGKIFTQDNMPTYTPDRLGLAAQVYSDLRMRSSGGSMPPPTAQSMAQGLVEGRLKLDTRPGSRRSDGSYGVADPKDPSNHVAYLSADMGDRLLHIAGASSPQGAIPMRGPVGAGAGTPAAVSTGRTGGFGGASSAIPSNTVH